MASIVVPFRGADAKRRLGTSAPVRAQLALAMLGDVLAACVAVGPTLLVTSDPVAAAAGEELGAELVDDPGGGQGGAVAAGLARVGGGPALVVNADLPCVAPRDLRTLAGIAEAGAVGLVEARDGTTNALALPAPSLFAPLYGPASAERFRAHARGAGVDAVAAALPNLVDDVDTLADLEAVSLRVGPRTQSVLAVASLP